MLYRENEEKRANLDGNVSEVTKELQRMESKKHYLDEEKTDLSEALDRQRHIFESKVRSNVHVRCTLIRSQLRVRVGSTHHCLGTFKMLTFK